TFEPYAVAALADTELDHAVGSLESLRAEALLTEVNYHRYTMHDLVRRYASQQAADADGGLDAALERLLHFYLRAAGDAVTTLSPHLKARFELPCRAVPDLSTEAQARAWFQAERASLLACLDWAAQHGEHLTVLRLTDAMYRVLEDGQWTDAISRYTV